MKKPSPLHPWNLQARVATVKKTAEALVKSKEFFANVIARDAKLKAARAEKSRLKCKAYYEENKDWLNSLKRASNRSRCDGKKCHDAAAAPCNAISTVGYRCTRHVGHRGPHVACAVNKHNVDAWERGLEVVI